MKRFLSVLLSSLLLVLSVPGIPAKSAPLYLTGDQAYEIYLSILSLIETGRLASGYDNSIFSSDFADFQSNIAEINIYLATHSSELAGIDYYWNDGSSALKEDWVDEDWDLDGDGTADATGTLSNKLSVLTQEKIDELENFNSGMNDNSFNENNNNPFDILKKVAIGAAVGAGTVFGCLSGFWENFIPRSDDGSVDPSFDYKFPYYGERFFEFPLYAYMNLNYSINNTSFIYTVSPYRLTSSKYFMVRGDWNIYLFLDFNNSIIISNALGDINTNVGSKQLDFRPQSARSYGTNLPLFLSTNDALNFYVNGTGRPLNCADFDYVYLAQNISNMVGLPLIDTEIRPFGFIGINNGLSVARHDLNISDDPDFNTDDWEITVPDVIEDILPDYHPDNDPIPPPQPVPDPDPIPDPIPDPQPEPDPDPDIGEPIVDDEGDLTEIPIVSGLQGRFPFSIPWDIKHLISNLSAEREAPSFEYDFYISPRWLPPNGFLYHFDIDLSGFDYLASLFRRLFLLSFIIGLAVYSYAKFFGGGE